MRILRHPEHLALVRFGPGTDLPPWAESSTIFAITATATETTVLCAAATTPRKSHHRAPLLAYRVDLAEAPDDVPPDAAALVAALAPAAEAGVVVTPTSTFDATWLLVAVDDAEAAEAAWREAGHDVGPAPAPGRAPTQETDR